MPSATTQADTNNDYSTHKCYICGRHVHRAQLAEDAEGTMIPVEGGLIGRFHFPRCMRCEHDREAVFVPAKRSRRPQVSCFGFTCGLTSPLYRIRSNESRRQEYISRRTTRRHNHAQSDNPEVEPRGDTSPLQPRIQGIVGLLPGMGPQRRRSSRRRSAESSTNHRGETEDPVRLREDALPTDNIAPVERDPSQRADAGLNNSIPCPRPFPTPTDPVQCTCSFHECRCLCSYNYANAFRVRDPSLQATANSESIRDPQGSRPARSQQQSVTRSSYDYTTHIGAWNAPQRTPHDSVMETSSDRSHSPMTIPGRIPRRAQRFVAENAHNMTDTPLGARRRIDRSERPPSGLHNGENAPSDNEDDHDESLDRGGGDVESNTSLHDDDEATEKERGSPVLRNHTVPDQEDVARTVRGGETV